MSPVWSAVLRAVQLLLQGIDDPRDEETAALARVVHAVAGQWLFGNHRVRIDNEEMMFYRDLSNAAVDGIPTVGIDHLTDFGAVVH